MAPKVAGRLAANRLAAGSQVASGRQPAAGGYRTYQLTISKDIHKVAAISKYFDTLDSRMN
jgi:hypothetical protein